MVGHGIRDEFGVVIGPGRVGDAVHRPGVDEVGGGIGREVTAVVGVAFMPVTRGDDEVIVAGVGGQVCRQAARNRVATGDGERSALREVVLDIDDEQCSGHTTEANPSIPLRSALPVHNSRASFRFCRRDRRVVASAAGMEEVGTASTSERARREGHQIRRPRS